MDMAGAATNPDPDVFAFSAATVKTCMDAALVATWPVESVTFALKPKRPEVVFLPVITPPGDSERPGGNVPSPTAHVYGGVPPPAWRVTAR
jgi:hypothetical protein